MSISNLAPPDELAQVRDQIKALQSRESELKTLLIAADGEAGDRKLLSGIDHVVEVRRGTKQQLDERELKADKRAKALIEEHTHTVPTCTVVVLRITADGEIVSRRRKIEEPADV